MHSLFNQVHSYVYQWHNWLMFSLYAIVQTYKLAIHICMHFIIEFKILSFADQALDQANALQLVFCTQYDIYACECIDLANTLENNTCKCTYTACPAREHYVS